MCVWVNGGSNKEGNTETPFRSHIAIQWTRETTLLEEQEIKVSILELKVTINKHRTMSSRDMAAPGVVQLFQDLLARW